MFRLKVDRYSVMDGGEEGRHDSSSSYGCLRKRGGWLLPACLPAMRLHMLNVCLQGPSYPQSQYSTQHLKRFLVERSFQHRDPLPFD